MCYSQYSNLLQQIKNFSYSKVVGADKKVLLNTGLTADGYWNRTAIILCKRKCKNTVQFLCSMRWKKLIEIIVTITAGSVNFTGTSCWLFWLVDQCLLNSIDPKHVWKKRWTVSNHNTGSEREIRDRPCHGAAPRTQQFDEYVLITLHLLFCRTLKLFFFARTFCLVLLDVIYYLVLTMLFIFGL